LAGGLVAVIFDETIWAEAIRPFSRGVLEIAVAGRSSLESSGGVQPSQVRPCQAGGPDGTLLARCFKLYLPLEHQVPSNAPFAFVFELRRRERELALFFLAFGRRHPRTGERSVYERAHKVLHGAFPDERAATA